MHEHPVFWALLALAPLPALSLSGARASSTQGSEAGEHGGAPRGARTGRRTHRATRARFVARTRARSPSGSVSSRRASRARARSRARCAGAACRRDLALDAERFLRQLDEAAFSASGVAPRRRGAARGAAVRKVDRRGAAAHADRRRARSRIVGLLAIGVATAHAYRCRRPRGTHSISGVAAYEQPRFRRGARGVHRVGRRRTARAPTRGPILARRRGPSPTRRAASPRGSARFASSRSRRTCAIASSSCTRFRGRPPGYVPPLPAAWVFNLAAVLWLARVGARRVPRRRAIVRSARRTCRRSACRRADRHRRIRAGRSPVRAAPGACCATRHRCSTDPQLGGERGATAIIGEVVRVTGRQGAWSRVVLDDGRDGWIEASALVSLDMRDAIRFAPTELGRAIDAVARRRVALRGVRRLALHASPFSPAPSPTRSPRARSSSARRRSSRSSSRTRSTPARRRSISRSRTAAVSSFASATTAPACRATTPFSRSSDTRRRRSARRTTSSACGASAFAARRSPRSARCRTSSSRPRRTTAQGTLVRAAGGAVLETSDIARRRGTTVQRRAPVLQRAGAAEIPCAARAPNGARFST